MPPRIVAKLKIRNVCMFLFFAINITNMIAPYMAPNSFTPQAIPIKKPHKKINSFCVLLFSERIYIRILAAAKQNKIALNQYMHNQDDL